MSISGKNSWIFFGEGIKNYDREPKQMAWNIVRTIIATSVSITISILHISAFSLGRKAKKGKKKGKNPKPKVQGYGHSDAVLSLAWNKHAE